MQRIGVIGATGYAGAELVRILSGHPGVRLSVLSSRQYAGVPFSRVYPSLTGVVDMELETPEPGNVSGEMDVAFLALPHKLAMDYAPGLLAKDIRIVDLSADFRFKDISLYEKTYQPHSSPGLLESAVYGLPEVFSDEIRDARLVGNPGCYPTSALLPLIPLFANDLIEEKGVHVDSKSGVSGAGRSPSLTTHFCEVAESFKAYKVASHRHSPEMEEVILRSAGKKINLTFVPHLVPMSRGMLTTIYAAVKTGVTADTIRDCLTGFYENQPFVRIRDEDTFPDTRHVRGTNYCDIGFKLDERNGCVILLSAIDNLVKGASGQAVQNMNIMLGLDPATGLLTVPAPV